MAACLEHVSGYPLKFFAILFVLALLSCTFCPTLGLHAVLPEALHELLPVLGEVVRSGRAAAHPDVAVVVVQGFLLDVLILACHHFVAQIQVLCRLFKRDRFYEAFDLVVIVAQRDCALTEYHVDGLCNGAGALVFELLVDREGHACLSKFSRGHFWMFLVV